MRELLDRSSQRYVAILDIFLSQEGWITIPELSSRIGAGTRTISDDLDLIKDQWGEQLGFEVSTKLGFRINHQNTATVSKVFKEIFAASIPLQWLQELFFSPKKNIDFFQDRLFTSPSTLNRLFHEVNTYLKRTQMEIVRNNGYYEIVGKNETYLRQIFSAFLLELHGFDLKKWKVQLDVDLLRQIVQTILKKNLKSDGVSLILKDDLALVYLMTFFLVSLIREDQGYHDSSYDQEEAYGQLEGPVLEKIRKVFPNINDRSIQPIYGFILSQYLGWDDEDEQSMVEKEAKRFFENLLSHDRIQLEEKQLKNLEFILNSMYLTQKSIPYRTSTLLDRIYYFAMTVKKHNFPLYQAIEINLAHFSERTGMDLSSKLPQCVYWICLVFPEINYSSGSIKILVISDLGMNHSQFLARFLKNYFKNDYNDITFHIEAYPAILERYFFDDYQIILTTILDLPIEHGNIVLINDYPTQANMFDLYKASRKVMAETFPIDTTTNSEDAYSLLRPNQPDSNKS